MGLPPHFLYLFIVTFHISTFYSNVFVFWWSNFLLKTLLSSDYMTPTLRPPLPTHIQPPLPQHNFFLWVEEVGGMGANFFLYGFLFAFVFASRVCQKRKIVKPVFIFVHELV